MNTTVAFAEKTNSFIIRNAAINAFVEKSIRIVPRLLTSKQNKVIGPAFSHVQTYSAQNMSKVIQRGFSRKLITSLSHVIAFARLNGGGSHDECVNLLFRNGPCDLCGGSCMALLGDGRLLRRLLTGKKAVGTFCRRHRSAAKRLEKKLRFRGLSTFVGKNKWNVWVVVATLSPDVLLPRAGGSPREVAFTQEFFRRGAPIFGYPSFGRR